MQIRILLALTLAMAGALPAQSTWNQLSFGMSLEELRAALLQQQLHLQQSDTEWQAVPRWDLSLPGVKFPFHFSVRFSFSNADRLERIRLFLQTDLHRAEGVSPSDLATIAATAIHEQLLAKYGAPLSQSGLCDALVTEDLNAKSPHAECRALWRAADQTITLQWSYGEENARGRRFLLTLSYLVSRSGGL